MREKYNITKEFLLEQFFEMRKSQKQIAKEVGCGIWIIEKRMRDYGLTNKIEDRYKVHIEKMTIKDPYFVYTIGLFLSDGTLKLDKRVAIRLLDRDILEVLGNYFDTPIYITHKGIEFIIPKNVGIYEYFEKMCHGNKEKNGMLVEKLNKPMFKFFLRGIIDGDGCIDQVGYRVRIGMCSINLVNYMKRCIKHLYPNLNPTILTSKLKSGKDFYTLTIYNSFVMLTDIYAEIPELAIQRKRNIIKNKVDDIVRTVEMINLQKWG